MSEGDSGGNLEHGTERVSDFVFGEQSDQIWMSEGDSGGDLEDGTKRVSDFGVGKK